VVLQRPAPIDTTEMHTDGVTTGVNGFDSVTNSQSSHDIEVMRGSVIIAMTMLLKAYLKSLYGLSEEKCSKFMTGKKSAVGDKPAAKRHEKPISWDRLPFSTTPLLTSEDINVQKTRFLEIWNEDGLTAEPDDLG